MITEKYWEDVALKREIAIQDRASEAAFDIVKIYDEALDDINSEIAKIKANFKKRFGIEDDTAAYFLDKAQSEENLKKLIQALEDAPTEQARQDILDYIQRDGLSVRAYSSRIERYNAVKDTIYAQIKAATVSEMEIVTGVLTAAYKQSYYGMIDDTAKGLNAGVSFGIINENAVNEAVNENWSGKRFSERIWNRTDDLATQAQEIVVRYLESGRSLNKAADELVSAFDVAKNRAVTLVHTETAHVQGMADKKAYEDLDIQEYKYLATLDYMTCSRCSPLDGMVFKVSEAKEGVNYPVMHPNCRCTTTINIKYTNRRARNPLTGKNEVIDGSVTYDEWYNNLSDEQKNAIKESRKKDSKKTADKLKKTKATKTAEALKFVDNGGRSGIMSVGSDTVALENQRYGRNKSTIVNKTYINSGEYRKKFDKITDNPEVNRTLYNSAKDALFHRSGTMYEDMYWIDGDNGNIVAKELESSAEQKIVYSVKTEKALRNNAGKNIIALHTHPSSMPPSGADFNSCFRHGYQYGCVTTHDGKVYVYSANEMINERMYDKYIEKYLKEGHIEIEAQQKAIEQLKKNYKIDFWEVT